MAEKPRVHSDRGTESGTPDPSNRNSLLGSGDPVGSAVSKSGDFADALAMIATLPLSPAEKAEAVRRLLAGRGAVF